MTPLQVPRMELLFYSQVRESKLIQNQLYFVRMQTAHQFRSHKSPALLTERRGRERGMETDSKAFAEVERVKTVKSVRSLSKNREQLRSYLISHKNRVKENQIFSPSSKIFEKYYSCYGSGKPEQRLQTKSSLRSDDYQQTRNTVKLNINSNRNPEQQHKKQKTESKAFKLIGQIKREQIKMKLIKSHDKKDPHTPNEKDMPQPPETQQADPVEQNTITEEIIPQISLLSKMHKKKEGEGEKDFSNLEKPNVIFVESKGESAISGDTGSTNSLILGIQSQLKSKIVCSILNKKMPKRSLQNLPTNKKIQNHLTILETLKKFVEESRKFHETSDEWAELDFLIFKKYYIERVKVLNFLKKFPMKNPFNINSSEIPSKQIIQFMKTEQGSQLRTVLEKQNCQIKQQLHQYYSEFDKNKVGGKINMYEYDNFSHWIIEDLWAELILTEYNTKHTKETIHIRLCKMLQAIFLISEFNGQFALAFYEGEYAIEQKDYQNYIDEAKDVFHRRILYKEDH